MKNNISTFTFGGHDIDMTYKNGNLAYTFEHDGKHYGYKTKIEKKDIISIASMAWVLLQNAVETIELLKHNDNKGI